MKSADVASAHIFSIIYSEEIMNKEKGAYITGTEEIRELFTHMNFLVRDVDIDEEENLANVYIDINSTLTYSIETIETAIKKVKELEQRLVEEGLIEYILIGDLYQGSWRILVYFKKEE